MTVSTATPLTFSDLFGSLPTVSCKRFGPAIEAFIAAQAEYHLALADRSKTYAEFLTVMADEQIDAKDRYVYWLRTVKGFERLMDRVMMHVAVINFKCKHERMPTLEDILGDDDGFEDFYNHQEACADYVEPTWPQDWSVWTRRRAYQAFTNYMAGVYERACAEHARARRAAYAA
jgi:hypothetical protein